MIEWSEKHMKKKRLEFEIGDYVKVKKGVLDPENEVHCIEDWQGKIIGEPMSIDNEPLFLIKWDNLTLKNMPETFIIESIQEDLEFGQMYLSSSEIVHVKSRNNEEDEDEILKELNKKYDYIQPKIEEHRSDELYKQEQRIAELLKGINVEIEAEEKWEEYLENNLKFPFEATIVEWDGDTEVLDYGDIVSVKKIEGSFDLYGIVVEVRKGRRKYNIPLCLLEVKDKSSDNYIKVDDYNVWFSNR